VIGNLPFLQESIIFLLILVSSSDVHDVLVSTSPQDVAIIVVLEVHFLQGACAFLNYPLTTFPPLI
jgi:hypothetical protein